MNIHDLNAIAVTHGIDHSALSKHEIIKTIQVCEGNFDCFATAHGGECEQGDCCWREDCFIAAVSQ